MKLIDFDAAPPATEVRPLPKPLLLPAVGLIAGIGIDNAVPLATWIVIGAIAVSAVLATIARRRTILWPVVVALIFAALGAARNDLAMRRWPADHVARFVTDRPILGSIRGIIIDAPEVYTPEQEAFPRPYAAVTRTRVLLDSSAWIDTAGAIRPVSGKVLVFVTQPMRALQPGDEAQVFGLVSRIARPANPGEFDRRLQLARDGVLVTLSANTAEAVSVLAQPLRTAWRRWLRATRMKLAATLRETGSGAADESVGSVLDALILAKRSGVERSINEAFLKTGNSHLLAASGMNVGWLVLCVLAIGFLFKWHYRTTSAVSLAVLLAYVLLAEPNPPILRAVLMGALACVGLFFRQRLNIVNWLAGSAIALLLSNPGVLFTASFQLSFVVVLGLILLYAIVPDPVNWIRRRSLGLSKPPRDLAGIVLPDFDSKSDLLNSILDIGHIGSICSLTAWLVGLPLSVYFFGAFAPWGFLNSFLLAPFAFVVMVLGFLKLLLALVIPPSVYLTGPPLNFVTETMNDFVRLLASCPWTSITIDPPSAVWVMACYALMLIWLLQARGAAVGLRPLRIPRHALKLAAVLLAIWPFLPVKAWLRPRDRVTVWTLAVGGGTATIIELPDGRTLLYDCGSRSPYDVASRTVVPFLRWRGIRSIDYAFVSHPDLDHFSGIEGVAKAIPIRRIVLNEHFEDFGADQPAVVTFLQHVRDAHLPIEYLHAGWKLPGTGDAVVECIWPPPAGAFITSDNSTSTVLRITYAGRSMLLPGDIDNYALDQLIARGGLASDAMQLPHHGSVTISTGKFLNAVGARIAIRSSSQHDRATTNGLLDLVKGTQYFSTADDGCVSVKLDADGVSAAPFRVVSGSDRHSLSSREPG